MSRFISLKLGTEGATTKGFLRFLALATGGGPIEMYPSLGCMVYLP